MKDLKNLDNICEVRHSNLEDVDYLCLNLRQEDEDELKILNVDARYALAFPFTQNDSLSYTITYNKIPLAMFGTIPAPNNEARIWMLCTDDFQTHYREICRHVKDFLDMLQSGYSTIYNIIPVKNRKTIRFLKFAGFEFGSTLNINDTEFIKFFRCNVFNISANTEESRPVMH